MASAARKKQAKKRVKTQRGSGAKRRAKAPSRAAKSRTPRATGLRRAKPAPKQRATKKSATKKRATKKPATKKPATKPAVVRASQPHRAVKPVLKRAAPELAPMRPARKPGKRRAAAPVPPAFAVQRASADARGLLLFELARARAAVKAAIQGLTGANALRPIAPGKWSSFEIVLHLSERDRVRLEECDRTLAGEPRTWADVHDPEMSAVNEAHLAPLRAHTWDEAVRRMDSLRDELLQRLGAVLAKPEHVWKPGHAFGDMMWGLPAHDRLHATQIKNARIGGDAPLEA